MRRHTLIESRTPGRWLVLIDAESELGGAPEAVIVGYVDDPPTDCENERCLEAIAAGRPYHAMARWKDLSGAIVNPGGGVAWPTYHFATREEAVAAVIAALDVEAQP